MLYPMKRWTSGPSVSAVSGKVILGLILVAGAFVTEFAADPPLLGARQLDPEQSEQAALYLFSPTRCSVASAASGRPDIADMSKSTADELRAIREPLLAVQSTPTSQPLGDAPP